MVEPASIIDKSIFDRQEEAVAVKVPVKLINLFTKKFKEYIFMKPKYKSVRQIDVNKDDKTENPPLCKLIVMQERFQRSVIWKEFL